MTAVKWKPSIHGAFGILRFHGGRVEASGGQRRYDRAVHTQLQSDGTPPTVSWAETFVMKAAMTARVVFALI